MIASPSARARRKRLGATIGTLGVVVASTGMLVLSGAGANADTTPTVSTLVALCHANNNDKQPYVVRNIAPSANGALQGHEKHAGSIWEPGMKADHDKWGDIIPDFYYRDKDGLTKHFLGMNWTLEGRGVFESGCVPTGLVESPAPVTTNPAGNGSGDTGDATDQSGSTTDPSGGTTNPGDGQTTGTTNPGDGQTTGTTNPGDGQTTGTTNPGGGGTTGGGTGGTTGGGNGGTASGGNTGGHHSGHHHSGHHHAGHHGTHSSGPGSEILGTDATGHKGTQPRDNTMTEVKPASGTRPVANGGPVVVPTAVDAGLATWTAPTGSGETTLTAQLAEGAMGGGLLMLLAGGWLRFGRRERGAREA
jgi:hypothetical protein